jgi:hypothetical protein
MKHSVTVNATDNLGDQERADFKFAVNGKAFKVMLDDLYSNKIRGLIRELSSNAIDAQIEAGVDTPFDIHLPTSLYPEFRIRDYGTGLCHEDVMTMYVTLFESTKDDSDDVTGAFGLGSKIPFAYGDAFIVTSYLDGEKRTYTCNIGDGGVPGITYIKELTSETDEPNGLEVSVSVRDTDFEEFAEELAHLTIGFDPKPNVIGGNYQPLVPEWVSKDGRVQVIPRSFYNSQYAVKQGSAIYPINDWRATSGADSYVNENYDYTIVIDVPIGTVAISPNREALSIDDNTREALNREIIGALSAITDEISDRINSCKNRLEVVATHNGVIKMLSGRNSLDLPNHSIDGKWKPSNTITLHGGSDWEIPRARRGNSRDKIALNAFSYSAKHQLLFVVSHSDRPVVREGLRYRSLVKAVEDSYGDHREIYLLKDPTSRQIERLYTLLGLNRDQIVSVASLTDPGPPVRVKRENKRVAGVRPHSTRSFAVDEIDELPAKYYWYNLSRYNNVSDRRGANFSISRFVSGGFLDSEIPVLVFNDSALKKLNPPADMEIYVAAEAAKAKVYDEIVSAKVRTKLLHFQTEDVWAELGVELPAANPTLAGLEDHRASGDALAKVNEILAPLEQKYPLLFGKTQFEAIVCYINDRNNATEGSAQS